MSPGRAGIAPDEGLSALMAAITSMSSELDVATVLDRLVTAACGLTGARFGALGVISPHGGLEEFVHHGVDPETARRIGELPQGRGVLGHLVSHPEALRLHDLTTHPASVGFPPHHPPMQTFLGVPVRAHGSVFGNLYLTDKTGGGDFTTHDEQFAVALAAAAGVTLDHARAYRRAHDHEMWLETAAACTALLTSGRPRHEVDAEVVARVRERTAAQSVTIIDARGAAPGTSHEWVGGRKPVLRRMSDASEFGCEGDAWALVAPLRSGRRRMGALVACWSAHDQSRRPEIHLESVAEFGKQVALALDVAAAQTDRARLAVLEDRERIARDLHDMVIQRLFAIGLDVQAAAQDAVRPDVARRLESAVDDLDETIKDVRTAIFRLGTRDASSTGLRERVDDEVVNARHALGFLPRLRTDGVTALVPVDVVADAVAVVREALANVARHARAHEVVVRVSVGTDLVIEVHDDGVGLDDDAERGHGLGNLESRASERGGSLRVGAVAGGGTYLRWSVPLV